MSDNLKRYQTILTGSSTQLGSCGGDHATTSQAVVHANEYFKGLGWFIWDGKDKCEVANSSEMDA